MDKIFTGKKILYAVYHYKQLSESYIDWEMDHLLKLGADIEVFSEMTTAPSPCPTDIKIHYNLTDAINNFKPDIIHIHWLYVCDKHYNTITNICDIPITIRIHGFDFNINMIKKFQKCKNIKYIFGYEHTNKLLDDMSKIIISRVPINPSIHYSDLSINNKRNVLRVGAGLLTKNLELYIEVANMLPQFNFTLCIIRCHNLEYVCDDFVKMNNMLGGKCKIYINEPRENISNMMRESNIYLHTTNPAIPVGQPVSIAEAMTCGNYILARNTIGSAEYIGSDTICSSGKLYDTKEELISLLQETLDWDDMKWLEIKNNSIYNSQKYLPNNALKNLIDSFLTIL